MLGPYAEAHLAGMAAERLDLYDALLHENDQDLVTWVMGTAATPGRFAGLIKEIGDFARIRLQKM